MIFVNTELIFVSPIFTYALFRFVLIELRCFGRSSLCAMCIVAAAGSLCSTVQFCPA